MKRGELIKNAQCIIERTPTATKSEEITATKSEEILSLTADQSCSEAKALPVLIRILLYLRLQWCASCCTHIPATTTNTAKFWQTQISFTRNEI